MVNVPVITKWYREDTVEPCYNEDLGTMKITLVYQGKKK